MPSFAIFTVKLNNLASSSVYIPSERLTLFSQETGKCSIWSDILRSRRHRLHAVRHVLTPASRSLSRVLELIKKFRLGFHSVEVLPEINQPPQQMK